MDASEKIYVEKCLLKVFLTEYEVLMGERHWSKYQCEIFNFVDLCSGVRIVWSTTTRTRESLMPLLSLSPLNVLTH